MNSASVRKQMDQISRFWGGYPRYKAFSEGDLVIDLVLLNRHFLEAPRKLKVYNIAYIKLLQQEIELFMNLLDAIATEL